MADVTAYGLASSLATTLAQGFLSPGVSSAVALSSTKIRVSFDSSMTSNDNLTNLNNYTVVPTGSGISVYKVSIKKESTTYPTFVDITVSEMTNGQLYQVTVETGETGPEDRYGVHIGGGKNAKTFSGVGTAPLINYVESLGRNSVKIVFNESMNNNSAIWDKTKYSFDNGLTVQSVTAFSADTVLLETSDQTSGVLYTLTISN